MIFPEETQAPQLAFAEGDMEFEAEMEAEMETVTMSFPEEEEYEEPQPEAPTNEIPPDRMPRMRMDGNEWLQEEFSQRNRCTINDLKAALPEPSLSRIQDFYLEELGSGEGLCGGGLRYIVARAFQQRHNERLDRERMPEFGEAKWHFDNLVQHQSMSERQRKRQADLNQKLYRGQLQNNSFLKETFVPQPSQMGRYYGGSGQRHSMLELLPVPKASYEHGVAYVGPKAALKYAFASGMPIDDILVMKPNNTTEENSSGSPKVVLHVEQSQKAREWLNRVKQDYYGSGRRRNRNQAKEEKVVGVILMDWKDGFAYSNVKNNRGSVDLHTFNISPPKKLTNE